MPVYTQQAWKVIFDRQHTVAEDTLGKFMRHEKLYRLGFNVPIRP